MLFGILCCRRCHPVLDVQARAQHLLALVVLLHSQEVCIRPHMSHETLVKKSDRLCTRLQAFVYPL